MRIQLERTGGVAGIKIRRSIDSAELPLEEAKKLEGMLRKSRFFKLPAEMSSTTSGTDRFHYRLTIETGEETRTVEAAEAEVPESLRPLLHWIESRRK
jgi:hypothetical protein